jgi:glycosyltransferase involved in cell wall biosynthesis
VVDWELILVDDGSRDSTLLRAGDEAASDSRIRLVPLARNYGQSTATQAGFDAARGTVVVTMDGDLQNDPRDIPDLIAKLAEGYDLVAGYREERQDRFVTRKVPSRVANLLIRLLTGVPIRDNGCSLKAYRRELILNLGLYSDMHRFIPALAVGSWGARIAQVPVRHHARRFGESKYGLSRVWKVLTDLLTLIMLRWFSDRPLLMFAGGAVASMLVGVCFVIAAVLGHFEGGVGVVFPGVAVVAIGLSIYLLMLGLIAETALYNYSDHRLQSRRFGRVVV